MQYVQSVVFLIIWGLLSYAGYRIGVRRGRPALGAVLGFALGLIGLGVLMLVPRTAEAKARRRAAAGS